MRNDHPWIGVAKLDPHLTHLTRIAPYMGLNCQVLLTQNEIGQRWVDWTNLSNPPHDHESSVPTTLGQQYEFWSTILVYHLFISIFAILFSACPFFFE